MNCVTAAFSNFWDKSGLNLMRNIGIDSQAFTLKIKSIHNNNSMNSIYTINHFDFTTLNMKVAQKT